MSWMDNSVEGNVQTAIQSQTIQTALEANTSKISDVGFQSFLTSAPIPRFFVDSFDTPATLVPGAVVPTWTTGGIYHNPIKMFNEATGVITIPIDGYYSLHFSFITTTTSVATCRVYFVVNGAIKGINVVPPVAGTDVYEVTTCLVMPIRQGSLVSPTILLDGATNGTNSSGNLGGVWCAPFNQYVGGN